MADNNEPIMTSPTDTIFAVVPATTHASISTLTYITISNVASFATTLPTPELILTPLKKWLNKRIWADNIKSNGSGEGYIAADKGGKRPTTRKEGKRVNMEDI